MKAVMILTGAGQIGITICPVFLLRRMSSWSVRCSVRLFFMVC